MSAEGRHMKRGKRHLPKTHLPLCYNHPLLHLAMGGRGQGAIPGLSAVGDQNTNPARRAAPNGEEKA